MAIDLLVYKGDPSWIGRCLTAKRAVAPAWQGDALPPATPSRQSCHQSPVGAGRRLTQSRSAFASLKQDACDQAGAVGAVGRQPIHGLNEIYLHSFCRMLPIAPFRSRRNGYVSR
jgi:hypothetical protein